ncbi:MAG: right-handed parallel beta-helix repeat-containing protein [Desulfobacteraceae bacterium]|nr:right-handed parallel beta-helix repeat-containing protein [Desulfobacteraceae bacterium]
MADYFIDNEVVGGARNGLTWADAFQSFAEAQAAGIPESQDIYVKATGTPYREDLSGTICRSARLFCDAVGVGTARGGQKAMVYGSEQLSWSLYAGTTYVTDAPAIWASYPTISRGVWVDGAMPVTLKKTSSDRDSLGDNEFFYDPTPKKLYIDIGADPNELSVEVLARSKCTEIYIHQSLYGGIFRFGYEGHHNPSCYSWTIEGNVFEYNATIGFYTNTSPPAEENRRAIFRDNVCRHNGKNGVFAATSNGRALIDMTNNLIHDNGWRGIEYYGYQLNESEKHFSRITHNVIMNNSSRGVGLELTGGGTGVARVSVYNNIAVNNGFDLGITTNTGLVLTAGNNFITSTGGYTTRWNDATYTEGDIYGDPLVISGGKILKTSPCVDAGSYLVGVNMEGQEDPWGKKVHSLPNIGMDQGAGMPMTGTPQIFNLGRGMLG